MTRAHRADRTTEDEPGSDEAITFGEPRLDDEVEAAVLEVLRSGWLGTGPRCASFEEEFASYVGRERAVGVGTGTAALHLALRVIGVGPGDEVVTTPMTFAATANAILHCGARPVFADIDPVGWNLDPDAAAGAITERTAAVLPVHLGGRACDVEAFDALGERRSIPIVYDAAHALEARVGGRSVGGWGAAACYSFQATKNITAANGGMIATDDREVAERVRRLRGHGLSTDSWQRFGDREIVHYLAVEAGYNYALSDVHAAIGLAQLAHIERFYEARSAGWERYRSELAGLPLTLPAPPAGGTRHACHLFSLLVDDDARLSRDEIVAELRREGIGTGIHYVGLHDHPLYRDRSGLDRADFPVSSRVSDRTFSLPLTAWLEDAHYERVVTALRRLLA